MKTVLMVQLTCTIVLMLILLPADSKEIAATGGASASITGVDSVAGVDCSELSQYNWTFEPSQDLSVNNVLLSGAKSLLKADYNYSQGDPDYLPTSYTDERINTTDYVIHAKEPTHVYWRLSGDNLLKWETLPGGFPCGWSGVVTSSDIIAGTEPTQCFTDCSGLITALLCYANTQNSTLFKEGMKGSPIPEAGCRDPDGDCQDPNPSNYYRFFEQNLSDEQGRQEFQKVTLDELMPGDMIAYANTNITKSDTGHVMLVVAVADFKKDPLSKLVVVIDEVKSPHSCDTREINNHINNHGGIGMGIIKLTFDDDLVFSWKVNSKSPEPGPVALGRAL